MGSSLAASLMNKQIDKNKKTAFCFGLDPSNLPSVVLYVRTKSLATMCRLSYVRMRSLLASQNSMPML